ncbi:toll-like receptor Tollo [Dreissena polymorpha]|uniref:toll-like receptor Tollo n=1 Tax=Dreissena polymorpha TaxID=45954 RepID=UPI00226505B3|nr:toll-like receptor Tollo [Dreissena polymorpha]
MSFILDCGILGIIQILSSASVIAIGKPPGGPGIPELLIFQCEYPIWYRSFIDRLMPTIDDETKYEPQEFCSTIHWPDMNSTPWSQMSQRVDILQLTGITGYNNQFVLNDIEVGFLGRNFTNIIYLSIYNLPLKVTKNMFEGLNRLKVLDFIVKVDVFPVDTFSGLSQLVYFRFQDSLIHEISVAHFCNNSQLAFVQLRRNLLKTVNGKLLQSCSRSTLNSLDLGGNNFSTLTAGMFKDYNVNGVLEISNCSISGIQSDVFIGLENLLALDLSYNLITEIPNGTFSRMNNSIQGIFMSNNFVSMINIEGIFGGLENIINLDFSSNQINSTVGSFEILPNLFEIDFQVGDDIADAILKGIKESAVTIILLTDSFLKSRWGRFEFRQAHHHMMFSSHQKLVIIILEKSVLSQKLDLTLKSILYTKKYLQSWDNLFKEKLLHLVDSVSEHSETREDDALLIS